MVDTRRDLLQLLKEKQLYNTLYAAYIEVLHNLMAVPKESAA
jgi:predicted transcriptional regulator